MNQNIKVETNGEPKKGLCPAKGSGQIDSRFHYVLLTTSSVKHPDPDP